jgi:hypothetical protein
MRSLEDPVSSTSLVQSEMVQGASRWTVIALVLQLLVGSDRFPSSSRGVADAAAVPLSSITIRGHAQPQTLPATYASSWPVWTCELAGIDGPTLVPVEQPGSVGDGEGWINPTSYDTLYLPSDLPTPTARMALGVVMANGSPRYLMPSMVLTLETPGQVWRNRGLCSLPRARCWVDAFAPFALSVDALKLASFGQFAADVRFLEDQDGSAAWQPLDAGEARSMMRPVESALYSIAPTYDLFQQRVLKDFDNPQFAEVRTGYHFVDIPLVNVPPIRLPTSRRIRQFLTDFDEPRRLLELEDPTALDSEPCGETFINVVKVSAGGESPYLPDVYRPLYEEGNVIVS